MTKHDPSRASEATCRRLAEACHHAQDPRGSTKRDTRLEDAHRQYTDECAVPLRTRAEVDSEIARCARHCIDAEWDETAMPPWEELTRLCREETLPDPDQIGIDALAAAARRWVAKRDDDRAAYDGEDDRLWDACESFVRGDPDPVPSEEPERCSCEEEEELLSEAIRETIRAAINALCDTRCPPNRRVLVALSLLETVK